MAVFVNKGELARILGVSKPTMSAILDRYPDFPVEQRGGLGQEWQFDPKMAKAFIAAKKAEEDEANAAKSELLAQCSLPLDELVPEAEAPKALSAVERMQHAKAMLVEDKVAKERGFLVQTTEMRMRLSPVWAALGQFLQGLPGEMGQRYNLPLDVIRDMRKRISEIQREMHAKLGDLLTEDAPPGDDDEADEAA